MSEEAKGTRSTSDITQDGGNFTLHFTRSIDRTWITYLASFARVDAVVEAGRLVAANPAEDLIVAVELWKTKERCGHDY